MGAVSKMHGMRWKVNSDRETGEERGETKGDGLLEAECVISTKKKKEKEKKKDRSHLGSRTALSPLQLCLAFHFANA